MLSSRADLFDDELKSNCCLACTEVFVFPAPAASEFFMTYCGFNICFNKPLDLQECRTFLSWQIKCNFSSSAMLFLLTFRLLWRSWLFCEFKMFRRFVWQVSVCWWKSLKLFTNNILFTHFVMIALLWGTVGKTQRSNISSEPMCGSKYFIDL